jgi:hypothetical protein
MDHRAAAMEQRGRRRWPGAGCRLRQRRRWGCRRQRERPRGLRVTTTMGEGRWVLPVPRMAWRPVAPPLYQEAVRTHRHSCSWRRTKTTRPCRWSKFEISARWSMSARPMRRNIEFPSSTPMLLALDDVLTTVSRPVQKTRPKPQLEEQQQQCQLHTAAFIHLFIYSFVYPCTRREHTRVTSTCTRRRA